MLVLEASTRMPMISGRFAADECLAEDMKKPTQVGPASIGEIPFKHGLDLRHAWRLGGWK